MKKLTIQQIFDVYKTPAFFGNNKTNSKIAIYPKQRLIVGKIVKPIKRPMIILNNDFWNEIGVKKL